MNSPVVDQHIVHFEVSTFTVFNLRKRKQKGKKVTFYWSQIVGNNVFLCKEVESKIDSTVSHNYIRTK